MQVHVVPAHLAVPEQVESPPVVDAQQLRPGDPHAQTPVAMVLLSHERLGLHCEPLQQRSFASPQPVGPASAPPELAPPPPVFMPPPPPELVPPELVPPEFAPPEFAPPEFAPPEFAPPEFAPPVPDPP